MSKPSWKVAKNENTLWRAFSSFVIKEFATRAQVDERDLSYHPALSYFALNASAVPSQELIGWAIGKDRADENIPIDWISASLQRQQRQFNGDTGAQIQLLSHPLTPRQNQLLQEARQILKQVWPEAARLESQIISHYIGFEAQNFWSSSDPSAFGAIFLNPAPDWCVLNYFETIVHEMSHHSLMLIDAFEPLLKKPTSTAPSPLRVDERPLKGILHAVFVLRRMVESFDRLLESSSVEKPQQEKALKMRQQNWKKFEAGLNTLSKHALWTTAGQHLLHSFSLASAEKSGSSDFVKNHLFNAKSDLIQSKQVRVLYCRESP